MAIAFYFLLTTLPIYLHEVLKADKSITGLVLSSYTIASLIMRPFTGTAVDTIGRKGILLTAYLIFSLLFGVYVFAATVLFMTVLRIAHGLAWGATSTASATFVVDIIPASRRGEGIGYYGLSMVAAMAIGPAIALWLIVDGEFNRMFLIAFMLCVLSYIMLLFVRFPPFVPHPKNSGFEWKNLFEVRSLVPSSNAILTQLTYGGLLSFVALYGKEIGIKSPGLFFVVFAGGLFISRSFSGRIFDKDGPRRVMITGFLLLITAFILLSLDKNYTGYLISAFLFGIGNGITMPSFQAMVNNMVEPHRRGAANSSYFTAFDLGISSGMAIIGTISEFTSMTTAFLISSAICFAGMIYFLMFVVKYYERNRLKV